MKSLVIFYSRSGNTQFVAETIATNLGSDLQPLVDKKKRKGFWGYILAGRDAMLQKKTEIEAVNLDLYKYDVLFLGCPNWAANLPPAIRTFLTQVDLNSKKIILFCTQDGMGAQRVFNNLRRLAPGAEIVAEKYFDKVAINKEAIRLQVRDWVEKFKV
jgi:flavodoxin